MTWKPLLPKSHPALRVAEEIASALQAHLVDPAQPPLRGRVARALLFSQAHQVWPDRGYGDAAEHAMGDAMDDFPTAQSMALYEGCTSVAWTVAQRATGGEGDANEAFDEQLLEYLNATDPCGGEYDLISGIVGVGVYALERTHRPTGAKCVERIVELLRSSAVEREDGTAWFTPPAGLSAWQRKASPGGYWNVGLAHGVPGAIGFLGQAAIAPIRSETRRSALSLLEGAARWVLAQRLPKPTGHALFPCHVNPDGTTRPGRVPAWCYGDLGIAASLLVAARAVGRAEWESLAVEIARSVATVPGMGAVVDAGLCHGAAGALHLFNRMAQITDDLELAAAAHHWVTLTLDLRTQHGIGGYQTLGPDWSAERSPDEPPPLRRQDDAGFLSGSVGIALALIAAATAVEPKWDRLLLVSPAGK
jgi:hypothetical protein